MVGSNPQSLENAKQIEEALKLKTADWSNPAFLRGYAAFTLHLADEIELAQAAKK